MARIGAVEFPVIDLPSRTAASARPRCGAWRNGYPGDFRERNWNDGSSGPYFLEEFAIFCCLKDSGLPVMLYPGSFGTLSEIAAGEHEGAPKQLRDLIVVSLRLRGR
ncbi:hypothetical protein [Streptomyces platensis]|uniref:hypothetical protein n=1 Tax=Streptomyces platensis TaxID=58346 RepID=UPI002E25E533